MFSPLSRISLPKVSRFTLSILGSASAKPRAGRASSAQLLQAAGRLFLIDCSEGVQARLSPQNDRLAAWASENRIQGIRRISRTTLDAVFISHIHGDHMFGLFGLLATMGMNGRTKPLMIFGPNSLGSIINFYKSFWGERDSYEIVFTPLKMKAPETILEFPDLQVQAFPLNHGIDCYGFIFREIGSCLFRKAPYAPRSYAFCSDTAPFPELSSWVKGVDLLYHESTYPDEDIAKAQKRMHSTCSDAARCALEAGVGHLLVGHYSASIKEEDIHTTLQERLGAIFPNSTAVDDGDIFDIPMRML